MAWVQETAITAGVPTGLSEVEFAVFDTQVRQIAPFNLKFGVILAEME